MKTKSILLFVILVPVFALAQSDTYKIIYINGTSLSTVSSIGGYLREKPDINSKVLKEMKPGDTIHVGSYSGSLEYYNTSFKGVAGFLSASAINNKMRPNKGVGPYIGMTESDAIYMMGSPERKNATTNSSGKTEQWVYPNKYLYFEGGVLRSFSEYR